MLNMQELLLHYIDECIGSMRRAPETWGSPECLELQALQLMELRSLAVRPITFQRNHRETMRVYHGFLSRVLDSDPTFLLSSGLAQRGRLDELPKLIGELYSEVKARLPPEDVFKDHDLVLELALDKGAEPKFSTVCAYYEGFQKALRGILRSMSEKAEGKTEKETRELLQAATDYTLPEMRIVRDDEGTRMQVSLLQPTKGQLRFDGTTYAETSVREAIRSALSLAKWAEDDAPDMGTLHQLFPNEQQRKSIAVQTMRIIPEEGVKEIRVGGRFVGQTEPAMLNAGQAIKLVSVLKEGEKPRPFSYTGVVRAVDLDQKSFRLRYRDMTIRCWVPDNLDALNVAAEALARKTKIAVTGNEYRIPRRRPFVETADVALAA